MRSILKRLGLAMDLRWAICLLQIQAIGEDNYALIHQPIVLMGLIKLQRNQKIITFVVKGTNDLSGVLDLYVGGVQVENVLDSGATYILCYLRESETKRVECQSWK